jgi:hypothetical protein
MTNTGPRHTKSSPRDTTLACVAKTTEEHTKSSPKFPKSALGGTMVAGWVWLVAGWVKYLVSMNRRAWN